MKEELLGEEVMEAFDHKMQFVEGVGERTVEGIVGILVVEAGLYFESFAAPVEGEQEKVAAVLPFVVVAGGRPLFDGLVAASAKASTAERVLVAVLSVEAIAAVLSFEAVFAKS